MQDFIGLLKDDWQNLPSNIRYIFYGGISLIIAAWIGDHWSDQQQYSVPIFSSNESAFQWGCGLITFVFVLLLVKQFWVYQKVWRLRRRYPINELNHSFHLINFKEQWIYLIDEKSHRRFHIKNPQTIRDLGLYPEWYDVDISKDAPPDTDLTLKNGKIIKLGDYPISSAGIYTQGITSV